MVGQDFRIGYCEIAISLVKYRCFQLKFPGLFQPGHIGEFLFQLHTGCFASSLHGCHEHGATSGTFGETQQHVEGPFATLGWTFMGWWAFDPSKSIKTRFLTKGNDPQWSVGWFWTKHNMEFWPTQMRFWPTNMGKQYNQPNTAKDYHRGCMTNIKGTQSANPKVECGTEMNKTKTNRSDQHLMASMCDNIRTWKLKMAHGGSWKTQRIGVLCAWLMTVTVNHW